MHIQNSQSIHQIQQQVSNSIASTSSEPEIKRSVSFNETFKIGPIGGGHPISSGLHKTAIGVGNPHSKVLGPHFNMSDVISHSPGDTRIEQMAPTTGRNAAEKSRHPASEQPSTKEGFISKLFGKTKEAISETNGEYVMKLLTLFKP